MKGSCEHRSTSITSCLCSKTELIKLLLAVYVQCLNGCKNQQAKTNFENLVPLLQITSSLLSLRVAILEKKSLKVRLLQITLVFFFSVLSTSRDLLLSSLFRLNPLYFSKLPFLSQQNSEYPHLQINVMPFKTSPYLSRK